jgi:hypothetical protein
VYLEDAAGLAVLGTPEIAARVPAVISSLVLVVLLALLLAACGLPAGASAIAVLFTCATPMFLLFGAMTEPHVLGLAPTAALALLWQRTRCGFTPRLWTMGIVAAVATLTSWQAGLCAVCVAAALLIVHRRRQPAFAAAAGVAWDVS